LLQQQNILPRANIYPQTNYHSLLNMSIGSANKGFVLVYTLLLIHNNYWGMKTKNYVFSVLLGTFFALSYNSNPSML